VDEGVLSSELASENVEDPSEPASDSESSSEDDKSESKDDTEPGTLGWNLSTSGEVVQCSNPTALLGNSSFKGVSHEGTAISSASMENKCSSSSL